VPLTPGRSIAVDRVHEYGTPFFIEAHLPTESGDSVSPFGRLMVAQDTGSAIVGPARADLYWGAGDDAERIANRTHHPGHFVMLLPRELDLDVAGSEIPLPVPKPKIATLEARRDGTGKSANGTTVGIGQQKSSLAPKVVTFEVGKQNNKSKASFAHAGVIATGWQKSTQQPTPKSTAIEARKHDSKGNANSAHASAITAGNDQKTSVTSRSTRPGIEVTKHGADKSGVANGADDKRAIRQRLATRPSRMGPHQCSGTCQMIRCGCSPTNNIRASEAGS
jgi:3D domain-containing protein